MYFQEWLHDKYEENVFELCNDEEIHFLVQFAAPFTGGAECIIPSGAIFTPTSNMRDDALYMFIENFDNNTRNLIDTIVKNKYNELYHRWQGVSFYITIEQLRSYTLNFHSGSLNKLLKLIELSQNHENFHLKDEQLLVFDEIISNL